MSGKCVRAVVWLSLAVLGPSMAGAGPLDQARQLYQAGRFAEVDKALAEPLAQTPAPVEALRLSMQAAMADGRFVTADRRCQALLEQTGDKDADLVATAAELAGLTGQTTRQAEMLGLWLKLRPGKGPAQQAALWRLMEIGNDGSAFTRYLAEYGATPAVLQRGLAMQGRLYENGQAEDFIAVTDALLELAADDADLWQQAYRQLRRAADSGLFLHSPGKPADGSNAAPRTLSDEFRRYSRAVEIALAHPIYDPANVWEMIQRSGQANAAVVLRFADRLAVLPDTRTFQQMRDARLWQDPKTRPARAAQAILAWKTRYTDPHTDRYLHRDYVAWLCNSPGLFDKSLSMNDKLALFKTLAGRFDDQPDQLYDVTAGLMRACTDQKQLADLFARYARFIHPNNLRQAIEKNLSDAPLKQRLQAYRAIVADRPDWLYAVMDWLQQTGQNDLILKTAQAVLLTPLGQNNTRPLQSALLGNDQLSPEQRVGVLEQVYRRAGYCNALQQLVLVGKQNKTLSRSTPFRNFSASFNRNQRGSDPILTAYARLLMATDHRKQSTAIHKEAAAALAAYGGRFPAGKPTDALMAALLDRYYQLCINNKNNCVHYVQTLLDHLGPAGPWRQVSACAARSGSAELRLRVLQACLALKGPVDQLDGSTLAGYAPPKQGPVFLLSAYYDRLPVWTAWSAIRSVAEQTGRYAQALAEIDRLLQAQGDVDRQTLADMAGWMRRWLDRLKASDIPPTLLQRLAGLLEQSRDLGLASHVMALFDKAGRLDQAVALYRKGLDRLEAAGRFQRLAGLFYMMRDDAGRVELVEQLEQLARSMDPVARMQVQLPDSVLVFIYQQTRQNRGSTPARQRLAGMDMKLLDLVAQGLPLAGRRSRELSQCLRLAVETRLKNAGQARQVLELGHRLMQWGESTDIRQVLSALRTAGRWELLYLLADRVPQTDKALYAFAQQLRGSAAANIPGIFPVGPDHPAFPLYVAASELVRGNEQLAWEKLRDHTDVFVENPLRFDSRFVIWAIDKFRKVRGADDALLEQARNLCQRLLASQDNLDPAFVASLMLLRADIFRDLGKLEAAELEYKSLLSNPQYQKTPAGRQARFQLVELMIGRGNMTGAGEEIERWLTFPDAQLHTQAYYYKALMAFQDKDYKTCREMLNQVFERNYGHEQARLLEGEWRKKTRSLEDTDVYAGQAVELDRLIPGEELKLSIHDKNLSVIGEGSFIPVIVTTSDGKDRETVGLYPAPRTPNLFRSTIATALGTATPGNLVLEVNGNDTVRYEIDPQFLKQRGLEGLPAKHLRIVDDAWMSASAGRLLTEQEQKELALRQQVAAIRGEKLQTDRWASHRTVRPGNPLYVMVRDRDRDLSDLPDSLTVSLTTSSGDRLNAARLTETAAHSGLFRGAVPTALPLPRAYASDSAQDSDPAVLINSNRPGSWSTRPDAQPDKWVEVDTMGSHLVRRFSLTMDKPQAVSRLMLYGSFQGDPIRLGRFPAANGDDGQESRGGLTLHLKAMPLAPNQVNLNRLRAALRQLPDQPITLDRPAYDGRKNSNVIGHLAGVFHFDQPRNLTLTVVSTNNREMNAYVLLDGEVVLGGRVSDLVRTQQNIYLGAGAHRLEVFFSQRHASCDLAVAWKNDQGRIEPLPAQWFSVKDNPGLAEFLQDKAVITRTADGFVATFAKPVRLRKLRWHFAEYAGAQVTASAISLVDDQGRQILPVAQDFSTGLDNDRLEIAPGDLITIAYRDTRNTQASPRQLTAQLDAGFANARIGFSYEITAQMGQPSTYATAFRFRPGDTVTVSVFDPDADVSDKADTVDVIVRTASGREIKLKALEAKERLPGSKDTGQIHSAHFVAIVKTSLQTPTDPDTLQVQPGDRLQAYYLDQQNLNPGVPVVRATQPLPAVQDQPSRIVFYRGLYEQVPDRRDPKTLHRVLRFKPIEPTPAGDQAAVIDAATPLRIELTNPSLALHSMSTVTALVTTQSEIDTAKAEGRKPRWWKMTLSIEDQGTGLPNATFRGELNMRLSSMVSLLDNAQQVRARQSDVLVGPLMVQGADTVHLTLLNPQGKPQQTSHFKLATDAVIGLFDKNYDQPATDIHMGEKFHVQVIDPDQDRSDQHDTVTVQVITDAHPAGLPMTLTETLPHSGIFNGSLRTILAGSTGPQTSPPAGGGSDAPAGPNRLPATADAPAPSAAPPGQPAPPSLDSIEVAYGQTVTFIYQENTVVPGQQPGPRRVTGRILLGDDGTVELFSKRYRDDETAARVQFRMAECLFEMAKEYRKVNNQPMATEAIARGKVILEEAMQDYPNTSLVTEGMYLLANLHQELASEQMALNNTTEALQLYQQAISRFSNIISTWPDSPYAARAQFHKAMCLEKIGDSRRASEEYVRLCYAYPDSPLVADATIRLATHFYRQGRYDVSGRIYENFARHYPNHPNAPKVMFMAAQSHMKQAEVWTELKNNPDPSKADVRLIGRKIDQAIGQEYLAAAKSLKYLVEQMKDASGPNLRAEAMYWLGVAYNKGQDPANAYLTLKQLTFEYPETKWARMARGLLLQDEQLERMSRTR